MPTSRIRSNGSARHSTSESASLGASHRYGVVANEETLLNPLYEQMQTSVFERMSALAARYGAVNLGQGFPDFGWPDEILDSAARAVKEGSNQYAPSRGLPALREAVAGHYHA